MSSESRQPQGPNVDEVLADIEHRGDVSARLEFARLAWMIDVALTQAHTLLNDDRVHDGTADWSVMKNISERVVATMVEVAYIGKSMASFIEEHKPASGS